MRKHFYLVTEHEDDDRIGGVSISDTRRPQPLKNEEGPIRIYDDDAGDFRIVGKKVGLGYYDFDGESKYEDNDHVAEVLQQKIREVDREWAEKADVAEVAYDG